MTSVPPDPSTQAGAGQAVFVSDASRRTRAVRWTARIAALLAVAYVVMTVGGMVGASWVPRVSLPGVGPVTLEEHPGATPGLGTTAQTLVTPDLTRSGHTASTTSTVVSQRSGNSDATTTTLRHGKSTTGSTNPGGNTPGAGKTTTTRAPTKPSSPGHSGSAPGHTSTTVAHGH